MRPFFILGRTYDKCLPIRLASSNMVTCDLPNTALSLSSALILRLLTLSCKACFLMYVHNLLTTSVRANGVEPTTAANAALGVKGFMKAALGVRFLAGAFFAAFLAGAFLATAFFAGAFLAGAFLATGFLAGAFLAGAFFAATFLAGAFLATGFLAGAFFAGDFFAAVFFAAFFAVAIFIFLLEVSEMPLALMLLSALQS